MSNIKDGIEFLTSLISAAKQLLIAAVIVCLFVSPSTIGVALERMGLQEGDLWGFKWKQKFVETDSALVTSRASTADLEKQLKEANESVTRLSEFVSTHSGTTAATPDVSNKASALVAEAKRILTDNASAIRAANETADIVGGTIAANATVVSKIQADIDASSQWGVVVGGDRSEESARDELKRARQAGFSQAKMYNRQGWFRTVVPFPDRGAASEALGELQTKMNRRDAYVVNLQKWCPSPENINDDIKRCSNQSG